jgi:DNA-binding MarR family transcriptional regulator
MMIDPVSIWRTITSEALGPGRVDLTNRQTAILLTIHTEPGPHTVRALAARHGLGKPAVSRALDTLGEAGLVQRVPDPADRRSVLAEPTAEGAALIADMSAAIAVQLNQVMRAAVGAGASVPLAGQARQEQPGQSATALPAVAAGL